MSGESGKKPATYPKVFDIMRPGKVQPSASSRPIIVGHKPQVQDSTLTGKPALVPGKPPVAAEHEVVDAHDEVSAAPVAESPAQAEVVEPPTPSAATAAQETQTAAPPAKAETPVLPAPEPQQSEVPANETPAAQPESVAAAEPAAVAQPVVSFHHKHAGKRSWKWLVMIVIILVLAAVALDILLDAGTITTTSIPHTHFLQH